MTEHYDGGRNDSGALRKHWRRFRALAMLLPSALLPPSLAGAAEDTGLADVVGEQAAVLLTQLDESQIESSRQDRAEGSGRLRLAVVPFNPRELEVDASVADQIADTMLALLIQRGGGRYAFSARDELEAIIGDMSDTGEVTGDQISALLSKASDVDVLVVGKIRRGVGRIELSWKAVTMGGRVLAATLATEIALDDEWTTPDRARYTLGQAIDRAARHFRNRAAGMGELWLGGVYYGHSGEQPSFGRDVEGKLSAALQDAFADVVTERALVVHANAPERGMSELGQAAAWPPEGEPPEAWRLSGRYQVIEQMVELRLTLRAADGRSHAWEGRIRRDSVGERGLLPRLGLEALREYDGLGPIDFQLSSDRGHNPVYHIGEKMKLIIRLGETAWIYCYHVNADRAVVQLIPNPYFWDRNLNPHVDDGPRFERGVRTVPGKETFLPFDLSVMPPVGSELTKCFATSRNVTEDLPEPMRGHSLEPLPERTARRMSGIFQGLSDVKVTEQSLVITVGE